MFLNARNPSWRIVGAGILVGIVAVTAIFVGRTTRPLKPTDNYDPAGDGTQGRFGTVTEPLGKGLFTLNYDSLRGHENELQLRGVTGRLEEPLTQWTMISPAARKSNEVWTLMGPMRIEAHNPGGGPLLGQGAIAGSGPALGWEQGVWHGLSPLVWNDLQGSGQGRWDFPAGWYRGLDGRFVVEHGPVHWTAANPATLKSMDADSMWAGLGFQNGHLEKVSAQLEGGEVKADVADIEPAWVRWTAPISFRRDDGWAGTAAHGEAPRPPEGKPFDRMEFQDFNAHRAIEGGLETLHADGARWTPAGLRLEGGVRLEQPMPEQPQDGKRLVLRAPRLLQRVGPGTDLPADLPVDAAWAEPQAVLTWGLRSLSSPRIEGWHRTREWKIQAPAFGKGEMGSFRAGEGRGKPARWTFDGPIQAELVDGAQIRGETLLWENAVWTLTGHPVTWTRTRERLSGPRLIRKDADVLFPDGLSGALAGLDGDITLRADHGLAQKAVIHLDGRVECQGAGWRLQADRISVTLAPGNIVKKVGAEGAVVLKGQLGEGRGDALDLDPEQKTAQWHGRVKALTEVRP
jgi:hypothetical protein